MSICRQVVYALSLLALLLTGCSAGLPAQETALPAARSEPATPQPPTAAFAPTASPTDEPTPTPAPSMTPTDTAEPTFTLTPTEDPNLVKPGIYDTGGCSQIGLLYQIKVDLCVVNVEITEDNMAIVAVSWTLVNNPPSVSVTKLPDTGNNNMIFRETTGYVLPLVGVTGGAAERIKLYLGQPVYGTFIYGPIHPDVVSYEYKDADNGTLVSNIELKKILYTRSKLPLKWYPFTLEYRSDKWTAGKAEQGGATLSYNRIPQCIITEWEPSEPKGAYKSTLEIVSITYKIYGWFEKDFSIREYQAVSGLDQLGGDVIPFFHLDIPLALKEECLNEASMVFSKLAPAPAQAP